MDKREVKSRKAIYEAFRICLKEKDYNSISITDILEVSKVSRSTFYSHFKSKDDVLKAICNEIFDHVLSPSLVKENDHDFSSSSNFDYSRTIIHIFYHFYDEKILIKEILTSGGSPIFVEILKSRALPLFKACIKSHIYYKEEIPEELQVYQLTESFVSIIKYYIENECNISPEMLMNYFNKLYS